MNSSINSSKNVLKIDTIEKVLNSYINDYEDIECVFHGGEPFFQATDKDITNYIKLVKKYNNVKWSATTNLTYDLNDKIIELFSLFNEKFIKTSWDVDNYRFVNDEQKEKWASNVKFLLTKGFNIQVIVTLNKYTLLYEPREIIEYFKKLGLKYINFERITETGRASVVKVKPNNSDVDQWLTNAYIYANKCNDVEIQIFKELEDIIKGNKPVGCRQRECMKNVITVNSDDTIATCPNISNIHIINSNGYNKELHQSLINNEKKVDRRCLTCSFYNICRGDCCQLKFDDTGCPGLKNVMTKMLEYLK